jgi:hypothetical protein
MYSSTHPRFTPRLIMLAGFFLATGSASAASQCKGQLEAACLADGACVWVNGYTRKDGRSVASYCKLKGGKPGSPEAKADAVRLGRAE